MESTHVQNHRFQSSAYTMLCVMTAVSALVLLPSTVLAADSLRVIVEDRVLPLFTSAISFIMTLSVLAFMVGVIRFIYTAGDDKSRSEGKQLMIWGTIALFVMVTLWGIVGIIKALFFGQP